MENIKTAYNKIQDLLDDADGVFKVIDEKAMVANMEDGRARRVDVTTHAFDNENSYYTRNAIEIDTIMNWGKFKKEESLETGEVILETELSVKVRANGIEDDGDITDYIRGIAQLNAIAKQIRNIIQGKTFYQVVYTAEEAKEMKAKKESRRIDNDVKDAIIANRKNMRVGTIRRLSTSEVPNVPNDVYERKIDGKSFQLTRKSKYTCQVARVA